MKLIVNPHKIELIQEEAVNEKEINVSECEFIFNDEITDDFVKEAYFTLGDETYKKIIVNNKCTFPQEVLIKPATIELGVVAYYVEDEEELIRYNPTPVYFKTDLGSLKDAENSQEPTPSEMEQYEQALEDGLSQVANVDIDASKSGNTATVTITNRYGEEKAVNITDGADGAPGTPGRDGVDGRDGADGITPTIGDNGNWYLGSTDTGKPSRGATGATGQTGPAGADGRDGYVQYTAGDNITIENNVISSTGGGSAIVGIAKDYNSSSTPLSLDNLPLGTSLVFLDGEYSTIYLSATINNSVVTKSLAIPYKYSTDKGMGDFLCIYKTQEIPETVTESISIGYYCYDTLSYETASIKGENIYIATTGISFVSNSDLSSTLKACTTNTAQTITKKKTFSVLPESSVAPTTDNQLSNKKYVDDTVNGSSIPTLVMANTYTFSPGGSVTDTTMCNFFASRINAMYTGTAKNGLVIIKFDTSGKTEIWSCNDAVSTEKSQYDFYLVNTTVLGADYQYALAVRGSWTNDVYTCSYIATFRNIYSFALKNEVLTLTNTNIYTPSANYHPATKVYADATPLKKAGLDKYYTTLIYNSGDYVYRSDTDLTIYKCNTDGATSTWDSSKWDSKTYLEYLQEKTGSGGGSTLVNGVHYHDVYSPSNTCVHVYRMRTYLDYDDITMGTAVCEAIKNAYNDCRAYFQTGFNIIRIESGEYTNTAIEYTINWNGSKPTGWQMAYVSLYSTKYFGRRMVQFLITWSGDDISAISNYTISSDTIKGLAVDNTTSYTPTSNYHPATKKYVDDAIATAITDALGGSY